MTTETTTTKVSFREAIDNVEAAYAAQEKALLEARAVLTALDALPKTKTGKDTKAVKEAKKALDEKHANARQERRRYERAYLDHVAEHAFTYNAGVTALPTIELSLEEHGFHYAPDLTEKCRAATRKAKADNGSTKVGFNPRYLHETHDFVFIKVAEGKDTVHVIIRRDDEGVQVRYISGKAPVDGTPYGTLFREDDNALSSFHGIGKYSVNISAVGEEDFDEAVARLARITDAIKIQKTLTKRHKTFSRHLKDFFLHTDLDLVKFLAENRDARFGFRVNEQGNVEPCGFIASDKSIVYGSKID